MLKSGLMNQVHMHIEQSTKNSLIDDLSKRLLVLEFKLNKNKMFKTENVCQKILPTI